VSLAERMKGLDLFLESQAELMCIFFGGEATAKEDIKNTAQRYFKIRQINVRQENDE
jgi:hypothetical protein